MATVFLNFYVNWWTKILQESLTSGGEVAIPPLFKYQSVPIKLRITELNPSATPEGYSLIPIANLSLKVSIHDTLDTSAPKASQTVWDKNTSLNEFTGVLDLNTSAMNTYVGANASVAAYLQIEVTEAAGVPYIIYQSQVTIKNSVTQPTTTSPDPLKSFYTAEQTDGLFLKPIMGIGQNLTFLSPDGTKQYIIGVDNNGTPIATVLPYP